MQDNFSPLTGAFRGSAGVDTYQGSISFLEVALEPDEEITGAAAFDLLIRSLGGDDRVEALIDIERTPTSLIDLIGIANADINVAAGNDTVLVDAAISRDFSDFDNSPTQSVTLVGVANTGIVMGAGEDTLSISSDADLENFSVNQSSMVVGVQNSSLNTGADNDTVTIVGRTRTGNISEAIALENSQLVTGTGDDVVSVEAEANAFAFTREGGKATGLKSSSIFANRGDDTISVAVDANGAARGDIRRATAFGLDEGSIFGGQGEDNISVEVASFASRFGTLTGLRGSTINGGAQADTVAINVDNSDGANSLGIDATSYVLGGGGADTITITTATGGRFGRSPDSIAVNDSFVFGGGSNDTITLNATAEVAQESSFGSILFTNPKVYGVSNGLVDGGNGSDQIDIQASARFISATPSTLGTNGGLIYGVFDSTVNGGAGVDTISIGSTTQVGNLSAFADVRSIGAVGSTINGGNGRDTIVVQGVNLDIDDVVIDGGIGQDVFDTGIGSGEISGGDSRDRIKLDFFDSATMTIELLGSDSIRIVGTQDKLGNSLDWTQTISEMEQFEVGDTVYNATDVVTLLG